MKDRTPQMLGLIGVLAALAIYANLSFIKPDYEYPSVLRRLLTWQGEEVSQRSLKLREGLDLQGGLQVLLQADTENMPAGRAAYTLADLEQARTIIQNRVDALGVTEPQTRTQGEDKIVVELPGVEDPAQAIKTIGEIALLEFIYAEKQNLVAGTTVATTNPVLFDELPEDKQKPFLGDPVKAIEELMGESGAADAADDAATAASDEPTAAVDRPTAASVPTSAVTGTEDITPTTEITTTAGVTSTGEVTPTTGITTTAGLTGTEAVTPTTGITATGATTSTNEAAPASDRMETIYPTVITGDYVADASVGYDAIQGVLVNFQLTGDGGGRMFRYTSTHLEEVMAIALDKKIISAPIVQGSISDSGQITGQFTQAEAESLVAQISSGALPVALKVVGQSRVSPTLGDEAIQSAVNGGLIGLLAVIIFMVLYYRMPGILATFALLLYALLSLTIFRLLPVTMTLAGIAGFVLSIGMAVDANILIFERMKEELRGGRRISAAMDIGFDRAWPSIRDSNFSTLITCMILFWFGNQFGASVVKGFAVTLSIGVLVSLFTAITATRTLLHVANRLVLHESDVSTLEDRRLRTLFGF